MQFPGKLQSRREKEELISLPVGGFLIYLQDILSNRNFLVDTGASRSVCPHHSSAAPTGPRLLMADGRSTKAWGSRTIPLQFGNRHFQFSFLLADVDRHILGADFLAEFDLLVDASKRQVLEHASMKPLSSPVMSTADPAVALAKAEFCKMEEAGIIRRSDSPSQQTKTREEHKIIWCISHE